MTPNTTGFLKFFRRERRRGDFIFAAAMLAFSLFLLASFPSQTTPAEGTAWSAQPTLWPAIGVFGMTAFAALNLLSSVLSPRIPGRLAELRVWLGFLEYAGWFLGFVLLVPQLGYLPTSVLFAVALFWRCGYRSARMILIAALTGIGIVVLFKVGLRVNVPGGALYELLPSGLRNIFIVYF
ncbi:MAG: tripartite tricarboxylate transporter TctB family protein [Marivita sp.]|uniref:tripartite tricarboxylate transporter TctB family protein n=1 Tax=Marivita sp. TaxID=2003365 RepID=UPI0025C24889|nr:tripartite tricarboxylate transporter TctB family protein [Marivita sp.]MCI5112286.1 tripartite tricarboxylate transporter TctB family protein [Marivita sp.]